ncbi:MAG: SDR family oxidoreductase [candidate division NC10 bacterium]|nr:SDR family oxidoreductase [candidate division NC10 bacterium]
MPKILVTGGAGFIGSHVVDVFLQEGHEVVVVDDLSSGKLDNLNPQATFYKVDITSPELEEVFDRERPEVLNHHAAQMDVRRSVADPLFDAKINVLGSLNLLEACRKYGTRQVIFASSGGALYGEPDLGPEEEDRPLRPASPYGVAKLAVERYLQVYWQLHAIQPISLRYANVYGPRQDPHGEAGVVAIFIERLLRKEPPLIFGDGEQTRDFVYIADVVEANFLALHGLMAAHGRRPTDPWVFNIGTGLETSVNRLLWLLEETMGTESHPLHKPPRPGEQRRSVLDVRRAERFLRWAPRVGLKEGLQATVAWFQKALLTQGP